MVKSTDKDGESRTVAPFLRKCYEMVDDESTDSLISWGRSNDSFVILDMTEFSVQLLPKYFKHSNFSSFIRQLNIYGFRKIDTDRWAFANDGFVRGQKHLLKNIPRRKYSQTSDQRRSLQQQDNSVGSCEKVDEVENTDLWTEVENLKTNKNALMQELVKLRQHQETAENKLILLKDRLEGMERSQQQLLSFLIMAMQNPGFLVKLLQPKEKNWCMAEVGNMLDQATEDVQPVASNGMIVRYQPPADRMSKPVLTPVIDAEHLPESSAGADGSKDFWMDIDFMKVLTDESHIPFIPPDLYDDGAWERLLLASPLREDKEDGRIEMETPPDSGMVAEVTEPQRYLENSNNLEVLLQHMGNVPNLGSEKMVEGSELDTSENLELLTVQMVHLGSNSNQE